MRTHSVASRANATDPAAPRPCTSVRLPFRLLAPLALLSASLLAVIVLAAVAMRLPERQSPLLVAIIFVVLAGGAALLSLVTVTQEQLFNPLIWVRDWARRIRSGNLSARIPLAREGCFSNVASDLNAVAESLQSLSLDMETQVCRQTERIEQKKRSLQVLYDVAASLNVSRDLSDLLVRFLHTMRDMVDAKAGTVRMLNEHSQMEMVASIGLDDEVIEKERMVPVSRCLCGSALTEGEVMFQSEMKNCAYFVGRPMLDNAEEMEMIAVPLQYRGETLGVYNLFVEKSSIEPREDLKALFTSIGRHLGMAIEKARLDSEAKRLFIMQERTALANELHDSLAQTLASLRFQVSMLQETLERSTVASIHEEIEQIKGGLDDAYTELRELLAHFRAPINTRGLLPALEDLVNSFRKQTGMYVLLQTEWDSARLPVDMEIQVLRIVQEALANVRKHSQAQTVRVMLKSDPDGNYRVLIEDDGIGLRKPAFSGHPGDHIGQSIMQERARRLGGELIIESEAGEGTRLLLTFRFPSETRAEFAKPKETRTIPLVRED
jgi:two-component system nitrate/nitrite sensor histidine kinase NarX